MYSTSEHAVFFQWCLKGVVYELYCINCKGVVPENDCFDPCSSLFFVTFERRCPASEIQAVKQIYDLTCVPMRKKKIKMVETEL